MWSAGCAAGEEAFSIAVLVHRALKAELDDWRLPIFATDIDTKALTSAVECVYGRESFENTKLGILDEYFTPNGRRIPGSAFHS